MFYNTKFKLWKRVADWWEKFKPVCKHWMHVISSAPNGRREIEVSECRWCKELTSELYIKGKPFDEYYSTLEGYGPVEACPITDDPPLEPDRKGQPLITLPNRDLYFERNTDLAEPNRDARTRKKTPRSTRRSRKTTARH